MNRNPASVQAIGHAVDGAEIMRRNIWENTDMDDPIAVGTAFAKVGVPPLDLLGPSWRRLFGARK